MSKKSPGIKWLIHRKCEQTKNKNRNEVAENFHQHTKVNLLKKEILLLIQKRIINPDLTF